MPSTSRLVAGHAVALIYLVAVYATGIFTSVFMAFGLTLAQAELAIAAITLVCMLSCVLWTFLDEEATGGVALLKRDGSLLATTSIILAVALAAFGFRDALGGSGMQAAVGGVVALSGIVGVMALARTSRTLAFEADPAVSRSRLTRRPLDTAAYVASIAFVALWVVGIACRLVGEAPDAELLAFIVNVAVVLAMAALMVRLDIMVASRRNGGESHG